MNAIAETYSDYRGGLYEPINWRSDKIYESYEKAYERVMDCKNNYEQVAVQYYDLEGVKETSKLKQLRERLRDASNELQLAKSKVHYKDVKSNFITCKHCMSKINREHLKSNRCPVCYSDMRPQSVLDTLKKKEQKIKKLEKELYTERLKFKNKAKVRWLVKIEYHV